MPLNEYAHLAGNIVANNTKYQNDKNIIRTVFAETSDFHENEKVIARLSVIDGFYSTQMNKRLWGIEEITQSINELAQEDNIIIELTLSFINNPTGDAQIYQIIKDDYGYKKNGQRFGKASSLITKYLYFITDYRFPIYDSLVRSSYRHVRSRFPEYDLPIIQNSCNIRFFEAIKQLNTVSGINEYNLLDNLLWLSGKIKQGSLSLIFPQDIYLRLIDLVVANNQINNVDIAIRNYLHDHIGEPEITGILGNQFVQFYNYCCGNNN